MLSFVSLPFIQGFRYSGLLVDPPGFTASGGWFNSGSIPTVSWVGFADFRGGHRVDTSANVLCYGCIAHTLPRLLTLSCLLSRVYRVLGQLVPWGDGGSAARRHRSKTGELIEDQAGPMLSLRLTHYGTMGGGGEVWVDLSGHSWLGVGYTAWNYTETSLPCGRQAVVFSHGLATNNLGQVLSWRLSTGVHAPFCEASPFVSISCGDAVAKAAVQTNRRCGKRCRPSSTRGPWRLSICPWTRGGFYSHYFLATKRTGGFCPILNLRGLNSFIRVAKFCMETLTSILQGLHKGWWMWSLDLKDAYLHVPIHISHWQDLWFALRSPAGELIV